MDNQMSAYIVIRRPLVTEKSTTLSAVNKYIWPMCGVLMLILVSCALFPPIVTFLPQLFFK
jgi:hypothetical protein